MTPLLAGKDARAGAARGGEYVRHQPERTLLYQLVEQYYPPFVEHLAAHERSLPAHVQREFEDYLKCGRLEHGFLRVRCMDCRAERLVAFSCKRRGFCPSCGARRMAEGAALLVDEVLPREPLRPWVLSVPFALRYLFAVNPAVMGQVLGIVTRAIASHLISAAGYHHDTAQTGAVTLIQRFGSALNLNIHFHMLFLDGVYVTSGKRLTFRRLPPPTVAALEKLVHVISQRVGRALERQGLLVRDLENSFLAVDTPDGTGFDGLLGHSITYRIALGPHQGRKAFTLQTVPTATDAIDGKLARAAGFSLHAGVACEVHEREKFEHLCRYITRPAVSTERLSLTTQGNIRYRLKTPYRDGTTDVVFEPLDFMARLAALVPSPRVNLTRYHGVFAPNHRLREQVTPARRGRRSAETTDEPAPAPHVSMTWAQRLKRVFKIDILTCEHCGGPVKVIASIEDPVVIKKILNHLARRAEAATPAFRPFARAPPQQELPGLKEPG
jgi:ribosomal protein S27E